MKIAIGERSGKCRWCGCTELRACGAGCSWANRSATLCSECVPLDRLVRTAGGRKILSAIVAVADESAGRLEARAPRRRRGFNRADLRQLRAALKSGRRSITFADQTVTFADAGEIQRLVAAIEARR